MSWHGAPSRVGAVLLVLTGTVAAGPFDWLKKEPKGEPWTIECCVVKGDNHRVLAEELAAAMRNVKQLDPKRIDVHHGPNDSVVYYGEYALQRDTLNDSVIYTAEINRDLQFIKSLSLGQDQFPFMMAMRVAKLPPDVGPPEWNLSNARGAYTLQIGVTYRTTGLHDYKQAAVDWVKDLRGRGIEAYYYHSPERPQSLITVGKFDLSAVSTDAAGRPRYSAAVESMRANEEFRYNLENGHRVFKTSAGKREPQLSFLVKIPQPARQAAR